MPVLRRLGARLSYESPRPQVSAALSPGKCQMGYDGPAQLDIFSLTLSPRPRCDVHPQYPPHMSRRRP